MTSRCNCRRSGRHCARADSAVASPISAASSCAAKAVALALMPTSSISSGPLPLPPAKNTDSAPRLRPGVGGGYVAFVHARKGVVSGFAEAVKSLCTFDKVTVSTAAHTLGVGSTKGRGGTAERLPLLLSSSSADVEEVQLSSSQAGTVVCAPFGNFRRNPDSLKNPDDASP